MAPTTRAIGWDLGVLVELSFFHTDASLPSRVIPVEKDHVLKNISNLNILKVRTEYLTYQFV